MLAELRRSEELTSDFQTQLEAFTSKRGWNKSECGTCHRQYFSKGNSSCGDIECTKEYGFLSDSRKEKFGSPLEVNNRFRKYFEGLGYRPHAAKSILNEGGTTLFTSAGVQILDDHIFREAGAPTEPLLVSQPSLRTQYADSIGEGNSLSFVNICTETVNCKPDVFFANLDQWIGFLSKLGLFAGDITLHRRQMEQRWGSTSLKSEIVAVYYKGLEIGDGNYDYSFDPNSTKVATISDFGFGLERINWIMTKGSYFDSVGPLTESLKGNGLVQEMAKTATLLASSGLEPSNKDKGYRYRSFAKKIAQLLFPSHKDLQALASYYHRYWSSFVQLPVSSDTTSVSLQSEYDRNYNLIVNTSLSADIDPNQPTEAFLSEILKRGIGRDRLIQIGL